ncbi:very-short-patch-repair endonuclease [Hymenobacter luteus]|uniref:Very-short-patch-repair endonuclease n=2 Tax=Hymenobacter TaxID=89966 RepID=A0A7W9SYJ2_9BACT|nr:MULTISPECIES: endonuclease domain-containing protein [Hymenobacter]MBB4599569.1 very-short-patch-repair endonuclease [Hymenobacter latericoloratus]MBB6058121.1 very-short-patch-repair endonuclease [Hymenobacter luteus]
MSQETDFNQNLELNTSFPSPPERRLGGEATNARLTADKSKWHSHLKCFSTEMRRNPTEAEHKLWQAVRNRQLAGVKFRRQHAVDNYIVDFISTDYHLIIEVDGDVHLENGQADYDTGRSALLRELGYRIVRFSNGQVLHELDQVLATIKSAL